MIFDIWSMLNFVFFEFCDFLMMIAGYPIITILCGSNDLTIWRWMEGAVNGAMGIKPSQLKAGSQLELGIEWDPTTF